MNSVEFDLVGIFSGSKSLEIAYTFIGDFQMPSCRSS